MFPHIDEVQRVYASVGIAVSFENTAGCCYKTVQ